MEDNKVLQTETEHDPQKAESRPVRVVRKRVYENPLYPERDSVYEFYIEHTLN